MNAQAPDTPADSGDISNTELLPFFSFGDLRRRAFLWPGVFTAVCGVALLLLGAAGNEEGFFWCLAIFISLANVYMVYLWCGKKMPFPYLVAVTLFAFVLDLLLSPAIVAMNKAMPALIGPGLVEEPVKALPLLFILLGTRFLSHARQRKYGVREPLDAIMLAAASATGFAFLETMFFYVPQYGHLISTPRLLVNIFGHIAYSVAFAYFIGLAALHHRRIGRVVLAVAVGFLLSNLLHDLWDAIRFYGDDWIVLSPLHEIVVAVASFVILASLILKAREISPEREFLWPFGTISPYVAPEVEPLPPLPLIPGDGWLEIGHQRTRLKAGSALTIADIPTLGSRSPDGVVAEVLPHPSEPDLLVLRNLSRSSWEAVMPDGAVRHVDPAGTVRILSGTRIDFGLLAGVIVLTAHDPATDLPLSSTVDWC